MSREQFVNHHPKTKGIGARIHLVSARLFWRHVRRRSYHTIGTRQLWACIFDDLRQSEVKDPCIALWSDNDVFRLDIAMNDLVAMCGSKRTRYLNRQRQQG